MCCVFDEALNDKVARRTRCIGCDEAGFYRPSDEHNLPGYCQKLAKEAAAGGIAILDCPLSGMVQGAIDGTLSLMIGGAESDISRCEEVLAPVGNVMRCGDVGSGQMMKLANNAISLSTFSLILELRDLVSTYGMDLENFMAILNASTGRSFVSELPHAERKVENEGDARKGCLDLFAGCG